MCSKYNSFLLSACLPVMALTLSVSTPTFVYAGFEWTPPESVESVEVLPEPEAEMVSPEQVMRAILDDNSNTESGVKEETQEPAIEITVIDDNEDTSKTVEATEETEIIVIEDNSMKSVDEVEIVEDVQDGHDQENIVIEAMDVETSKAPAPVKEGASEDSASAQSLTINPYPLEDVVTKSKTKQAINWNTPESFDVIEGFGKDMPLALALRQIVPAQYAFSFGDGVNPGMRISWQGGNPWNEVLSDALAPLGVAVAVHNTKVLLRADDNMKTKVIKKVIKEDELKSSEAKQEKEAVSPEFKSDVAVVTEEVTEVIENTEDGVEEIVEEIIEDNGEEIPAQNIEVQAAPEEVMNDALREVYGKAPVQAEEKNILDTAPMQLDGLDDDEASNTIVEELIEPVEVTKEQQETIPIPDMDALSEDEHKAKSTVIERGNILDPGQVEGIQPSLSGSDVLPEEKKK